MTIKEMLMKTFVRTLQVMAIAMLGFGLFSCSKNEEPEVKKVQADPEEVAALESNIDQLTKALTLEDLKDLGFFIKAGDTPGSIYLDITKNELSLVKGEVGRVSSENGPVITMDLMILESLPVVGHVVLLPLAKGMIDAALFKNNEERCAAALAVVNEAVDVQVMGVYDLQLLPVVDPETGEKSFEWFLVQDETLISINQLIEMLVQAGA